MRPEGGVASDIDDGRKRAVVRAVVCESIGCIDTFTRDQNIVRFEIGGGKAKTFSPAETVHNRACYGIGTPQKVIGLLDVALTDEGSESCRAYDVSVFFKRWHLLDRKATVGTNGSQFCRVTASAASERKIISCQEMTDFERNEVGFDEFAGGKIGQILRKGQFQRIVDTKAVQQFKPLLSC